MSRWRVRVLAGGSIRCEGSEGEIIATETNREERKRCDQRKDRSRPWSSGMSARSQDTLSRGTTWGDWILTGSPWLLDGKWFWREKALWKSPISQ